MTRPVKAITLKAITITNIIVLFLTLAFSSASANDLEDWRPIAMAPKDLDEMASGLRVAGTPLVFTESTPYWSEGTLEGCGYAFQTVLLDWVNNNNQPISVYGSVVYFLTENSRPSLGLRIGITNLQKKGNQVFARKESVNYSYLSFGFETTAKKETAILDGEEMVKIFIYFDDDLELLDKLKDDSFSIFFNRVDKGTDLEIKVKVDEMVHLNYLMCSGMLFKQAYDRF